MQINWENWIDIGLALDCNLSLDKIHHALASIFNIDKTSISIGIDKAAWKFDDTKVNLVCEVDYYMSDFPTDLTLVALEGFSTSMGSLEIVGKICEHFQCKALTEYSDGTGNPYLYLWVENPTTYKKVKIDPDKDGLNILKILED